MKINYPVKYAIMPIIEQVGWSHGLHELERDYDVVYYVVSKCYLINDLTKYKEDGSVEREYEVVFPYQPSEFNSWKREIPSYNLIHGGCINSNKVDRLFDTYEDALKFATFKNEKLCEQSWISLPIREDILERIEEKKTEFDNKSKEYLALQELILLNTSDMEITQGKKLDNVIEVSKNGVRVLRCNLYQTLQLFSYDVFSCHSISKEEYDNLIELIKSGNTPDMKKITAKGLALHKSKDDLILLASGEEVGAYYIENDRIGYNEKLSRVDQSSFEDLDDITSFYTTETIVDVLNSYKKYPRITREEIKEKVLKK